MKSIKVIAIALLVAVPLRGMCMDNTASFSASDVFALQVAKEPQISPDGQFIAYIRESNDIMTDQALDTLWLIDAKTGAQSRLSMEGEQISSPRWSPDGTRIVYATSSAGGQLHRLLVRAIATGRSATIATLPDSPSAIAWSPNGSEIAYVMSVPESEERFGSLPSKPNGAVWADPLEITTAINYRIDGIGDVKPSKEHLFLITGAGGTPRQLTFGPFNDKGPLSWTPDGKNILFSSNRSMNWEGIDSEDLPLNTQILSVDVVGGTVKALTTRLGPHVAPVVSPDGRQIAYVGYDDRVIGYQNVLLYVMNRDGGQSRALTAALDRSVLAPTWSADGKSIYVQCTDRAVTRIIRVALNGAMSDMATGLTRDYIYTPYTGGEFSVSKNGFFAFTAGTPYRPSDVVLSSHGHSQILTHLNEDLLKSRTLGEVRHIDVSTPDALSIDAWVITPPNFEPARRYPTILEIHGGPQAAYGASFSAFGQLYAAAGYVVLYANPRGSTSYGERFANLIQDAYPSKDYDDLIAAVDAAIARGYADPNNLFVTGQSGGGMLTAWIVGKTDRFKAAAAQKPVINWSSLALTSDISTTITKYWFRKYPWEDPEDYWSHSPLSLAGHVRTPTMVVVGTKDYDTGANEAEQYYAALSLRGVPSVLVKMPGAGHFSSRPSQKLAVTSAILDWFGRYRTQ
jgi:dipeptidyl aminopeptidase/acylaminoacyl peptidase